MNAPARAREFPEGIERRFALRSFIPAVLTKAVGSNGSDYATGTRGAFRATLTPPRPRQHTRSSYGMSEHREPNVLQAERAKKIHYSNEVKGARNCPW